MATTRLGLKNDWADLDEITTGHLDAVSDDLEEVTVRFAELLGQRGFLAAADANGSIVPSSLAVDITAVTAAVVGDTAGDRWAFGVAATTYTPLPASQATIYVYLLIDGTYSHNLTGTPPADSILAFTCATDANDVTSVNNAPAARVNLGRIVVNLKDAGGAPLATAAALAAGTSVKYAREDHVHTLGAASFDGSTLEVSAAVARIKDLGVTAAKLAADAVTTAKILNDAVTTAKIADDAVTSPKLDERTVQVAEIAVTNAELKALRAAPKELVAAPGAGKAIEFLSALLLLDYGTNVLTEAGDNLAVRYLDGTGVQVSETIETTGWIDQAGDMLTTARAKLDAIATKAQSENRALVLHNVGAAEFAGNAGNDTVLRVKVSYRVYSTGW